MTAHDHALGIARHRHGMASPEHAEALNEYYASQRAGMRGPKIDTNQLPILPLGRTKRRRASSDVGLAAHGTGHSIAAAAEAGHDCDVVDDAGSRRDEGISSLEYENSWTCRSQGTRGKIWGIHSLAFRIRTRDSPKDRLSPCAGSRRTFGSAYGLDRRTRTLSSRYSKEYRFDDEIKRTEEFSTPPPLPPPPKRPSKAKPIAKNLLLDELQSDWGQKAREMGWMIRR